MKFLAPPPPIDIVTREEAAALAQRLERTPPGWESRLALDTETTGLSITTDQPLFWSLSDGKSRWLLGAEVLLDGFFDSLFYDKERVWVFANAKYDMHMLHIYGVTELAGKIADVQVMLWLLDENRPLGLKQQSYDFLGIKMRGFREVFNVRSENDVPIRLLDPANRETVARYATMDAYATWMLSDVHKESLCNLSFFEDSYTAWDYFMQVEVPFTKTLWRMERRGFSIDSNLLASLGPVFEEEMEKAQANAYRAAKQVFKLGSSQQIKKIFFEELGLTPVRFSAKTGKPSCDADALKIYASRGVDLAEHILTYRKYQVLMSRYVTGIQKFVYNGRVHTTLKQVGTVTGRLSSSDPNIQNIPRADTKEGKLLRDVFVATPGHSLGVWDYGQVEMRIMAHMSGDQAMIGAISGGLDLHCFTAAQMTGVDYPSALGAKILKDATGEDGSVDLIGSIKKLASKVKCSEKEAQTTCEQLLADPKGMSTLLTARTNAKGIGFGIMYGQGPGRLGDTLGISRNEAKDKIDDWYQTFPLVRRHIEKMHRIVQSEERAVRTLLGRYRRLPSAASTMSGVRREAERMSVNAPIQGSAGDITKLAMLCVDKDPLLGGDCLEGGELGVKMLLQVHDEIICDVPSDPDILRSAEHLILEHMANPGIELAVPLLVEGGYAQSWGAAK